MNRRLTLILLAVLAALLITGFFLYRKNNSWSTGNSSSREFKIADTDKIGRIFIADRNGTKIDLNNRKGKWYLGAHEADEAVIKNLLKTVSQIEVINFVPKKGIPQVMKEIGAQGLKVEIFDKTNQKLNAYYVGSANQSGMQTFMVKDGSNIPYEVGIPGFDGSVRGSYWPLDLDDFLSRVMLSYSPDAIRHVTMEYPRNRNQSFMLDVKGNGNYIVKPLFQTTSEINAPLRKGEVEAFLSSFDKVYSAKVMTKNKLPVDTLISEIPFLNVSIVNTENDTNKLIIYPILASDKEKERVDMNNRPFGFFVSSNKGLFYSAQNRNLEKIFFGYASFFK